jgi:hypothetical protein
VECSDRFADVTPRQEDPLLLHPEWTEEYSFSLFLFFVTLFFSLYPHLSLDRSNGVEWLAYVQSNDVYIASVNNLSVCLFESPHSLIRHFHFDNFRVPLESLILAVMSFSVEHK